MYFIHSKLFRLCFASRKDIVDYRNIQLLSFFNRGRCQFLINVYLDNLYTAMDFLFNKALNISNLLYIGENLNIRDAEQNLSISSHPTAGQILIDLAKSYSLVYSIPVLSVPTHYLNIEGHAKLVINLIFLSISYAQVTDHIKPDIR